MLPFAATLLLACTSSGESADTIEPESANTHESAESSAPISAWAGATPLARAGHHIDITEVWLDPTASAALSLDGEGGVRLWPTFSTAADLPVLAPIELPLREPVALSFARTGEGSFLIAAIDTTQAGRVLEVRVDQAGQAELIERFTIPPSEPLFELHVLDDGARVLALGVDHRLRLFDHEGGLLDELAEHGFAPWQLRIVGRGESRELAVVLAQPTRVQSLELVGDQMKVVGEARRVRNDRGPNLNDLQLTPDGRHVTSFRRPKSKGHEWTLELLELASGEVRVLKGEVDGTIRPRLHLIDETRALLEDGTGTGYWIDLRGGVVQPPGFVLPEDIADLPAEAAVVAQRIPLAYSIERERWHASVVEGLRAVPDGRALILDPIAGDDHRRLGHERMYAFEAGFSPDGSRVAWNGYEQRWSEPVGERGELEPLTEPEGYAWSVAEDVRAVDGRGRVYTGTRGRDPTLEVRDAEGKLAAIPIAHERLDLVLPSPDGAWLVVVERERGELDQNWDRGPDTNFLSLYSMAELPEPPRAQWSIILAAEDYSVVWSPTSDKLAITERDVGGMVLSPAGEVLLERRHGMFVDVTASDAAIAGPQAEALRERQKIER
ncbi:hypothetical protein ACNOYE_14305 [Nannocystaceae bacterium ST9]